MPVSATVLVDPDPTIAAAERPTTKPSGGGAVALRGTATAELRELAAVLPAHARLARTHGHEMVAPSVALRLVNGAVGESGGAGDEVPLAALVLVGELVDGGSLRERVVSAAAAAAAADAAAAAAADGKVAWTCGWKARSMIAPSALIGSLCVCGSFECERRQRTSVRGWVFHRKELMCVCVYVCFQGVGGREIAPCPRIIGNRPRHR